ncbi:MAG: ABC transporter substrate-binding protein [Salinicola sp.]|uniref:aliphatic sulfonate ABC transporter substrate-binding protein n=1 Tax=uncultured Salinicola sp. TaxID=1193542 RepID=UPI000C8CAFC0|nr:aliphatic sulfonate ABC transporter substrate-binding protein [uncultured Salinicola sp.]MAM57405.1 ABC transporter substrate-binding protein [Salinicola sp.]
MSLWFRFLLVLVLPPALMLGAAGARAETVDIGYQRSSSLFILLKRSGELEARLAPLGYDVNWHEFTAGLLDALNAGSVDLNADVADAFALFSQAANAPLTYYAREDRAPQGQGVLVAKDADIRLLSDLKGKRVAVSRGSGSHFLLLRALQHVGLTDKDIDIRYLPAPDGLAAFSQGDVDAISIWDPFQSVLLRSGDVRSLTDHAPELAEYYRFYTATTAFAKAHPEVLQVVFDALVEQGKWVKSHPHEAAEILAPLWGNLPVKTVELANSHRSYRILPVDKSDLQEQQRIADTYHELGIIPESLKATDIGVWTPQADHERE